MQVTIIKYIKLGKIKGFKFGNSWRVTEEALREFIKRSEREL
ncbi:MAG: helix-turn-helix domain-containing protein [Candidatus Izemoplasma sp.]